MKYACDKCDYTCKTVPEIASHKRWQHPKRKTKKVVDTVVTPVKAVKVVKVVKVKRALHPLYCQHVPRPENFDISGCGMRMTIDHLIYIPDVENPHTVEYMNKERVCLKCRKRYKLDDMARKHNRKVK